MTISFSYPTQAGPTAHATVTLTAAAADRLRGQYHHWPFHDPASRCPRAIKAAIARTRSTSTDTSESRACRCSPAVGSGRTATTTSTSAPRSRIDLLLAPGEVVAVSLETIVSAEGDPLLVEDGQPDRETVRLEGRPLLMVR